jgi:archaeosortase C (PEF-CTERM variant)
MDKKSLNFVIQLLLIVTFFLAATIEFGHGSKVLGIIFAIVFLIILSRVKIESKIKVYSNYYKNNKLYSVAGVLIIFSVLIYNYTIKDSIGTLDMMALILGSSIFTWSMNNFKVRRLGIISAYMSFSFIVLYLILYGMFDDYIIKYNYYFVLVPSVNIANAMGISVYNDSLDIIRIVGFEKNIELAIGSTCNGINSMFLLVSLIIGYSFSENIHNFKKTILLVIIAAIVAYLANLIRVLLIFVVAYHYGLELMMTVHVHAGWIIFAVNSMIFLYILNRLMEYRSNKVSQK